MGWRGTLRGISAASNKLARTSERRVRQRDRQQSSKDRLIGNLEGEYARELQRVRQMQDRYAARPVQSVKLTYTAGGDFVSDTTIADRHGNIQYTFQISFQKLAIQFAPAEFAWGAFRVRPLAMSVDRFTTLVSFKLSVADDVAKNVKLVHRSQPTQSKVFLLDEAEDSFYGFDTDLNGQVAPGIPKFGVIAFQPFRRAPKELTLVFLPPTQRGEVARVKIKADNLADAVAADMKAPPFADQFEAQLRQQLDAEVARHRAAASTGCLFLFAVASGAAAASMSVVWALL